MLYFLPSLLTSVLVIVSFHWDRLKLSLLRITLNEFIEYRAYSPLVDIVVVTDQPEALTRFLHAFQLKNIEVHPFNSSSKQFTGQDKYDLLWEHREVVKERIHSPHNYSTFIYVEDDTLVPWSSAVSWAIDTEVLEPLGFSRGIFRTEINEAGQQSLLDMYVDFFTGLGCSMNITKDESHKSPHYVDTLDLMDYSGESRKRFLQSQEKHRHAYCLRAAHSSTFHSHLTWNHSVGIKHPRVHHAKAALCPVHSLFVNLYSPFQGMWIFTRTQLEKIMQDKLWDRQISATQETRRFGQNLADWGSPERSSSILYFINPPRGFHTSNVVPFNFLDERTRTRPRLSWYGSVEHTRYGYDIPCTVEDALVT